MDECGHCGDGPACRAGGCTGGDALSLRLRPAAQHRLFHRRRPVRRQAHGIEQGYHDHRSVSRRPAPQLLQLVKAGDIEFAIISSANTATISPQAGVMSLHFLFRNPDHVVKSLADKQVIDAIKAMIDETTQGLHVIATGSQGVRSIYSKREIHNVGDMKGLKIRVQATATEDALFPAYGAQTVHM